MLVQSIWEYVVHESMISLFELSFGPGGIWSNIFSTAPGFQGLSLLNDSENPDRYLVVESWESTESRARATANSKTQFDDLQDDLISWCESISEVGVFRMKAEGNVRPRTKRRRTYDP